MGTSMLRECWNDDQEAPDPGGKREWPRVRLFLAGILALAGLGESGCVLGDGDTARALTDPGGILLEPNTIRGHVRFTNQNPEILALLDSDPRRYGQIVATSTAPSGYSAQTPRETRTSLRGFEAEMQVEAAAGGPDGVSYRLVSSWSGNVQGTVQVYSFQPVNVLVRPPGIQPEPTEVDIAECVGVIRFQWGHDDTCTTPVAVSHSRFAGTDGRVVGTDAYHYVRGGTSGTSTLIYFIGSNPYTDQITHTRPVSWSVGCDEIATICTRIPDASELGTVRGPWHVVDEESTRSRLVQAVSGPESNHRYASLPATDLLPSDPAGWWTLPNMVPGAYSLRGRGWLRRGREHTWYHTPYFRPLTVPGGETTHGTLVVNGQERYPLVMHPAYMQGSIRLADPYMVSQPGAHSSLEELFFEADIDRNQDGLPDYPEFFRGDVGRHATALRALASNYQGYAQSGAGVSDTAFSGQFEPAAGELSSSYEHVLPNLYDLSAVWRQDIFRLGFWSVGNYEFVTRPGQYDPGRFRYGYLDLVQRQNASALLGPGQTHRVDHEYCFNEVQLQYNTTEAPFYNPTATITGSFQGTDWRGMAADYTASGRAWGIPAAIGIPKAEAVTHAENSGSVSFALPQGSYTVKPGATLVSPDGSINDATFQPLQFTLGCGQRLKLVPPLAVTLDAQPACADGPTTTVRGRVQSKPATVDHVWYRVNGGPEITLCTSCGLDPTFEIPVELAACENTVQVFAFSAGMPEPATGFVQLVWDEPADGPSCADATCVNRPPVARCQNLVLAADSACAGCGSVDAGSYDPDGDAVECVESASCPYALGRHRVTLTCTDAHGATDSCEGTVTVADRTAPELECPAAPELECVAGGADASHAPLVSDQCSSVITTCTPAAGLRLGLGDTEVVCTAIDGASNSASCSFTVTVADSVPPSVTCPEDMVVTCTGGGQAEVVPAPAQASDTCTTASVIGPGPGSYPVGTTAVTYVATDEAGNQASCTSSIIVTDGAAPDVHVSHPVDLWPPNHRMHEVSLADCGVVVSDGCSGGPDTAVSLAITCVTSDEPADSCGPPGGADIEWVDDTRVRVRVERDGHGDGRVYRIHFVARDATGNEAPGVCEVRVPHDQRCEPAADSGEAYSVCR